MCLDDGKRQEKLSQAGNRWFSKWNLGTISHFDSIAQQERNSELVAKVRVESILNHQAFYFDGKDGERSLERKRENPKRCKIWPQFYLSNRCWRNAMFYSANLDIFSRKKKKSKVNWFIRICHNPCTVCLGETNWKRYYLFSSPNRFRSEFLWQYRTVWLVWNLVANVLILSTYTSSLNKPV